MKPANILRVLFLVTIAFGFSTLARAGDVITLPSGNQVELLGMNQINFAKGTPALMLKYQTNLNLDNKSEVRREMDEVWERFVLDVEKARLTDAILSVTEKPQGGIVSQSRGYNFVLKKEKGKWNIDGPSAKENAPAKLTEPLVNDFINLWDDTAVDLNVDAALLYLTPDWTGIAVSPGPDGKMQSHNIDLKQFETSARSMKAGLTNYKYSREATQIKISPDEKSAKVSSKITETLTTRDGKTLNVVSETADVVQLVDGRPLVKSSEQKVVGMK